jgi:hypothetical protein
MNFVIRTYMKNGDTWETVRRCKESLNECIQCILTDKEVERFTVEEK